MLLGWVLKLLWITMTDTDVFNIDGFLVSHVWEWTPENENKIIPSNVLATAITFVLAWAATSKGASSVSWVVYVTCPLPVLLLIIIAIQGFTQEGAGDGIVQYIGDWEFKNLFESADVWSQAIGQCFFSLSICLGVMTAYASHNIDNKAHLVLDEKIIGLSDMGVALLGGFAIYSFLGHQCHNLKLDGHPDCTSVYNTASLGLAFGV